MSDELVKRHVEQLRMTGGDLADLCQPLADAIEALTADRDRLRAASDDVIRETFASYRQAEEAYTAHLRAEADNARLREALNQSRLAFAGHVSVQSAIDLIDRAALKGESQ